MQKRSYYCIGVAVFIAFMFLFTCGTLPTDPTNNPDNVTAQLFLSDDTTSIVQDEKITIGIIINIPKLVQDINVSFGEDGIEDTTIYCTNPTSISAETLYVTCSYSDSGLKTVNAKVMLSNNSYRDYSLAFEVVKKPFTINFSSIPESCAIPIDTLDSLRFVVHASDTGAAFVFSAVSVPEIDSNLLEVKTVDSVAIVYVKFAIVDSYKITLHVKSGTARDSALVNVISYNKPVLVDLSDNDSLFVGIADTMQYTVKCDSADSSKLQFVNSGTFNTGVVSVIPSVSESLKIVFTPDEAKTYTFEIAVQGIYSSDTVTITKSVNSSVIFTDTTAPTLYFVSPSKDTIVDADSCNLQVICSDPSGVSSLKGLADSVEFSLDKSAAVDSLWTATVKGLTAAQYSTVTLIATDASIAKNSDSVKIRIKYDNDTTAPVITQVMPAEDSISTNSSSYTVTLKCVDASGIASVTGLLNSTLFTGTRSTDSTWTIVVSGLVENVFNAVVFIVTDSSLRASKSTLTLHIKYDPTMDDVDGPTIKMLSGPESGTVIYDSLVTIIDSVSDPSGIDSVFWVLNTGTSKSLSLVSGSTGQYLLTDTVNREELDTIVVTAIDKSTKRNRSTQTFILNYIIPPGILTQPVSQAVCAGSKAIFYVKATGSEPLGYQWRKGNTSFTDISGATNPLCTLSNVSADDDGTILSCLVSNMSSASVASVLCTLKVNTISTKPVATATPSAVCPGASSILSVTSGTLGTDASWKWYTDTAGSALTTDIVTPSVATWYYVRGEGTCGVSAWDSVHVTVNTTSTAASSITASDTAICFGKSTTLSVSGGTLGTGAAWKWYTVSDCSLAAEGTLNSDGSEITIVPDTTATYYVRAEGPCDTTNLVSTIITVLPAITITSQPSSSKTVCTGATAYLSCYATGGSGTVRYQWYKDNSMVIDISHGSNSSSFSIPNTTAESSGSYYCMIADSYGCFVYTDTTVLTVNDCQ